jgi:hypothetical protein
MEKGAAADTRWSIEVRGDRGYRRLASWQIFFATNALKKDDGVPPGALSRGRSSDSA